MGDGGFRHPQQSGDIADAQLRLPKRAKDFHPGGVPKHLKQVREVQKVFLFGQASATTSSWITVQSHLSMSGTLGFIFGPPYALNS